MSGKGRRRLIVLVIVGSSLASPAHAQPREAKSGFDLSFGLQAATFPKSISAYSELGLGLLIWGQKKPDSYRYGYFRLAGRGQSSGLINKLEWKGEVFPVSALGLIVGQSISFRSGLFSDIHLCPASEGSCKGTLRRDFVGVQAAASKGSFFLLSRVRWVNIESDIEYSPFWDDAANLTGQSGNDRFLYGDLHLGRSFSQSWKAGVMAIGGRMTGARVATDAELAFVRFESKESMWKVALALGSYYSPQDGRGFVCGLNVIYDLWPSLSIY